MRSQGLEANPGTCFLIHFLCSEVLIDFLFVLKLNFLSFIFYGYYFVFFQTVLVISLVKKMISHLKT